MIPQFIENLISAKISDRDRIQKEKTQPQIKVSKAASFFAVLYEKIRNTVDYEEDHLLRKRAIKRILLRMSSLKGGNPEELAENTVKEIILAQYLTEFPVPTVKIDQVARTIHKYQVLIAFYKQIHGGKPKKMIAKNLYSLCSFEIERILVPYNTKDALVNSQFEFIKDKQILRSSGLPEQFEIIQTYINTHKANVKSDSDMILFHLFYNKFSFWGNPSKDQIRNVSQNLLQAMVEINRHLSYKVNKKNYKELVRQSIPFKILDKVLDKNLDNAQNVLNNKTELDKNIDEVCKEAYKDNKKKLRTTIIRSIIYIFITKIILALIIEVPYELQVEGHINYFTLSINILVPGITMFIVANSFSIPNKENTLLIKQMIHSILSKDDNDDKEAFSLKKKRNYTFKFIFQLIYILFFFSIFGAMIYVLYLLNFNIPSMLVFIIFFSTIFFVAAKLRNTASELKVVDSNPSIFAPFIDMFSAPILSLGKRLSEGASQFNFMTIVLDFIIETPFKTLVKVIEEWNHYVRETREDIV